MRQKKELAASDGKFFNDAGEQERTAQPVAQEAQDGLGDAQLGLEPQG